ncbi:signal peptidase I [Dermatophilaceae bacterium Sec6.4]
MSIARRLMIGLFAMLLGAAIIGGVQLHRAGYRAYIIHTGSMTGALNTGDLIIDRPASSTLHIGEVITFLHSGQANDVVTHRIVSLNDGTIQTKGDANQVKDTWNIRHNQVKGVVATTIPKAGYVVYFFKQPAGDAAAVTGVLALILLYGLFFDPTAEVADTEQHVDETHRIAAEA